MVGLKVNGTRLADASGIPYTFESEIEAHAYALEHVARPYQKARRLLHGRAARRPVRIAIVPAPGEALHAPEPIAAPVQPARLVNLHPHKR